METFIIVLDDNEKIKIMKIMMTNDDFVNNVFFFQKNPQVPLHTLIKITPVAYGCQV